MMAKDQVYINVIERLEPDLAMIDAGAGWASIAVSLKRIADSLEKIEDHLSLGLVHRPQR
jgi:hypothetical protein